MKAFILAALIISFFRLEVSASPASIPETYPSVTVSVVNQAQQLMVEATLGFQPDWTSISSGDPLTLEHPFPLSLGIKPDPNAVCDEDSAALSSYVFMLRWPTASQICPYPVNPVGDFSFYLSDLPNGGQALLQMPGNAQTGSIRLMYGDSESTMRRIEPLEVAKLMVAGTPVPSDQSVKLLELKVASQNCLNLIAAAMKEGQLERLDESAQLISNTLELYYSRHGRYPGQLCQLFAGPDAVVGALPSNPYRPTESLCISQYAAKKPEGYLRYFVLFSEKLATDQQSQFYWLAVLGQGKEVGPQTALPRSITKPARVIKWFEAAQNPVDILAKIDD